MQKFINMENIRPKGRSLSFDFSFKCGVHINTKIYIHPSKSEDIIPQKRIFFE